MRKFIILFTAKEGTTPLVRLLDKFDQIAMLHQQNEKTWQAWEPFDVLECGPMPLNDLRQCLDTVFTPGPIDFKQLNELYTKTGTFPLAEIEGDKAVGFKMRFTSPENPLRIDGAVKLNRITHKISRNIKAKPFKSMMLDVLKKHNVVVFFAVRQDMLRWGLSKYHGDGTGKSGHLQFKLAMGKISKDEIGKMQVDCARLEKIIAGCEKTHKQRRALFDEMTQMGIETHALCYEDFLKDKQQYFKRLTDILQVDVSDEKLNEVLQGKEYFKKVHSDEISEIVENHQEVMEKVGDRFFPW